MADAEKQPQGFLQNAYIRVVPPQLRAAFQHATDANNNRVARFITYYPGKCTAIAGAAADVCYLAHSIIQGDPIGGIASAVGLYTDLFLYNFADPKIAPEQRATFIDPQTQRQDFTLSNFFNWMSTPTKYAWEFNAVCRLGVHVGMFAGAMGAMADKVQIDTAIYTSAVIVGYGIKILMPQAPEGSITFPQKPQDAKWYESLDYLLHKRAAMVHENPNREAGKLFNLSAVILAGVAALQGEWLKCAFAVYNLVPNTLLMFTSKLTKDMPPEPAKTVPRPAQG